MFVVVVLNFFDTLTNDVGLIANTIARALKKEVTDPIFFLLELIEEFHSLIKFV